MPVINMNWHEAKTYALWLSEHTGKRYRLPSESAWEYAACAGTETAYSWGDEINCSQARYGRRAGGECSNSGDGPVPAGSFEPNPFGLYDLHGNVWEWVEDGWHDNYEGAPSDGSAWTGGDDGSLRATASLPACPGSKPLSLDPSVAELVEAPLILDPTERRDRSAGGKIFS